MNGLANLISYAPFLPAPVINDRLPGWEVESPSLDSYVQKLFNAVFISYSLTTGVYLQIQYRWFVVNDAFSLSQVSSALPFTMVVIQGLGLAALSIPINNRLGPSLKSLLLQSGLQKAVRNSVAKALKEYLNEAKPSKEASFWLVRDLNALKKFLDSDRDKLKLNVMHQTLLSYAFNSSEFGILHSVQILKLFIEKDVKFTKEDFFYIHRWLRGAFTSSNFILQIDQFPLLNANLYSEDEKKEAWKEACFSEIMTEWFIFSGIDLHARGFDQKNVIEDLIEDFDYVDPMEGKVYPTYREAIKRLAAAGADLPESLSSSDTEFYHELEDIQTQTKSIPLKSAATAQVRSSGGE